MFRKAVLTSLGAVLATSLAMPVVAQDEDVPQFIEEIVVLATKREQTLQEVPVAVSVVTAETIDEAQVRDIKDFQTLVPSLRVTQLQTCGNTNFIIRGVGNGANNAGIEPSVGVFVDGVYRSRTASALADLPKLQRVEVLRGPQSTLFGKNASAGVINIVTAKPDLNAYNGSATIVSSPRLAKSTFSRPRAAFWRARMSARMFIRRSPARMPAQKIRCDKSANMQPQG